MTSNRWIAIHTGHAHYLDHLGILCIELGLPLLVTEEAAYQTARKFYPRLDCRLVDSQTLSLDFLATNFDVIFESGHRWALELLPLFEMMFQKKMRIVYCPHGNSDKGHSQDPLPKDISLVYGSHMMDHLKKTKSLNKLSSTVLTGNYRYQYYQKNQQFYDNLLKAELEGKLDPRKKTVFYAPSWPDGENNSSFLSCATRVLQEVGEFYNVIIRWHPFLDDLHPVETHQLRGEFENKKGIAFLSDFPCIYPILSASDVYLGDFSSIGYDFLAFNKPLFFLDSHFGKLYQCGKQLNLKDHLGKSIQQAESGCYQQQREETYQYVFGESRKNETILNEIKEALSRDRASWTENYLQDLQEF
ncbi:MAG TPA: CDP-glycerol glycerophosphotransferase family protein [Rhabdochlamydiaceae bacterium]